MTDDQIMDDQEMYDQDAVDMAGTVYNSQGYPKRDGMETCTFFVKNGQCKFGTTCKWNHPEFIYPGVNFNSRGFPLRPEATECEFYAKTQECKFGCTCKYNHPEPEAAMANVKQMPAIGVNSLGYPRRPGAQQCAFFMKSGNCKFATTCKFDHPEKAGGMSGFGGMMQMQQQPAWGMSQNMGSQSTYNSKGYPVRPGVSMCQFFAKTGDCKFGSTCKWDHSEMASMPNLRPVVVLPAQSGAASGTNSLGLPMRPGSQPCTFFVKTGDCSYGEKCKWDHPEEYCTLSLGGGGGGMKKGNNKDVAQSFNSLGLPLRPGQGPCTFYMQKGTCSYGSSCKWDHPEGMGGTQPGFQKSSSPMTTMMRSTPY